MKKVIYYHGNCADGWCSAYVLHRRWPGSELIPCFYGTPPPEPEEVEGKDVIVVDFSWDRGTVKRLYASAASFMLMDHHATAEDEVGDLPYCRIDERWAGCQLAWQLAFGSEPEAWFVQYIADRDLWHNKLPETHQVNAYLRTLPYTIQAWDAFVLKGSLQQAKAYGYFLRMQQLKMVENIVSGVLYREVGGMVIPCVNAPPMLASDACHQILMEKPDEDVAGAWWVHRTKAGDLVEQWSLRGRTPKTKVHLIARKFGGGGHPAAAGFQVDVSYNEVE